MIFKILPGRKKAPVMKMVVPGIRSIGEDWVEVTLRPDEDGKKIVQERVATTAPATNMPHIIPSMGNLSSEEVDFILEGSLKASEYQSRHPKRRPVTDKEIQQMAQQMWQDYLEQKIAAFDGHSTFGPGGHTQRQSWGGPKEFNPRS